MYRYLFLVFAIWLSAATAVSGQALQFTTTTVGLDTILTNNLESYESFVYVTNNSGQPDTIYWRPLVIGIDTHTTWQLSLCDPNTCYYYTAQISPYSAHHFPAASGASSQLRFGSSPYCTADSAQLQVLMWLQHDSAASATVVTYTALYRGSCAAAISKVQAAQVKIYPSPVGSQLTVEGLNGFDNPAVYVYDMLGNAVLHSESNSIQSAAYLNTSALPAGVYIVAVESDGQRVITRRVEKFE